MQNQDEVDTSTRKLTLQNAATSQGWLAKLPKQRVVRLPPTSSGVVTLGYNRAHCLRSGLSKRKVGKRGGGEEGKTWQTPRAANPFHGRSKKVGWNALREMDVRRQDVEERHAALPLAAAAATFGDHAHAAPRRSPNRVTGDVTVVL